MVHRFLLFKLLFVNLFKFIVFLFVGGGGGEGGKRGERGGEEGGVGWLLILQFVFICLLCSSTPC